MAQITPFAAIRPKAELTETIASLPYDVFNRAEARAYVEAHPGCFLAIDRPETQFPEDCDMYADEVYEKARGMLWDAVDRGDYVRDGAACYYVYEQTFRGRTQTGIVACASIDDYLNGVIKKHENTRPEKEADRIRHVDTTDAQTGPIFLCYRRREDLAECIAAVKKGTPYASFTSSEGTKNRLFIVDNPEQIAAIRAAFADTDAIYIADGHHRCASAVKVGLKRREEGRGGEAERFLCVLFSDDELEILDYNRVVRDLNGHTKESFLKALAEGFTVRRIHFAGDPDEAGSGIRPGAKSVFSMRLDGEWYELTAKGGKTPSDVVDALDVSVLQQEVLEPLLGISDPKTDARIDFVGGIRGLKELERRCESDMKIAFALYPTSIAELFAVADAGRLMPPKSTWFEPKLLSGLFIHDIR